MAQMLPMIQVIPEMNFALDPATGIIGSSLGGGVVLLSMDEVNEQVAKVELAADELMASLDPYTSPVGSYPGREGSYVTAGFYRWLIKKLLQMAGRLLVGITL